MHRIIGLFSASIMFLLILLAGQYEFPMANSSVEYTAERADRVITSVIQRPYNPESYTHYVIYEEPSEEEVICMAENLYFEARGEGHDGMEAVAFVTMNRVRSNSFKNDVCGVVYQKNSRGCQFSWTCDGKPDRIKDRNTWIMAKVIAYQVIKFYDAFEDPTHGALFYHANYVRPYWAAEFDHTITIGTHLFYRS